VLREACVVVVVQGRRAPGECSMMGCCCVQGEAPQTDCSGRQKPMAAAAPPMEPMTPRRAVWTAARPWSRKCRRVARRPRWGGGADGGDGSGGDGASRRGPTRYFHAHRTEG